MRNFSEFRSIVNCEVQVYWFFLKGQFHVDLFTFISVLSASRPHPEILILHLDNDSFGSVNTHNFISGAKLELSRIRSLLPLVVLIVSEAYPVLAWVRNVFAFRDKIRKRINLILHSFLPSINAFSVRHVNLEGHVPGFYQPDGVCLSCIGLDMFNLNLLGMIELGLSRLGGGAIINNWRWGQSPNLGG